MLSSRFSPKWYCESEVSSWNSVLMSSFKTSFKRSLRSTDICLCALPIKVTESTVWSKTFPKLGGFLSFSASISSCAILRMADVAKINPSWISYNLVSALSWNGITFLFFATDSFNIGTRIPLQFAGIFKPSGILFTTTEFLDSSDQYFIAPQPIDCI